MNAPGRTDAAEGTNPDLDPRLVDPVRPQDKDEFYHDILDGLSVFMDSSYVLDILHAIREYPILRLGHSLNLGQVTCKKWVLDTLADIGTTDLGTIYILGGWYGVLGAMFLHDPRFTIGKVVSVDIEPQCRPVAEALNRTNTENGRFESLTADIYDLDYRSMLFETSADDSRPDVVINTSCEHLAEFDRWFSRIPSGTLMIVQSNDYFDCEEHHNCAPDLESFKRQAPLSELIYEGRMKLKKYTRFMLIGRR